MIPNNSYYLPSSTPHKLYKKGFKYSCKDEGYVYIYTLERYKKYPTLLCKITVYDIDDAVNVDVIKPNGEQWRLYYNQSWGSAEDLLKRIDDNICNKLNILGFKKKKEKWNNG